MGNIVAIVGRPNVGKSTLFNRLTESKQAIVDEFSGVTRDRIYGHCTWNGITFSVVDTGGYVTRPEDVFEDEIRKQVHLAIDEADVILFVTDVESGITELDEAVAEILRRTDKKVLLVVNKVDNNERLYDANEFYRLGLGDIFPISSINGSGTGDLLDQITGNLDKPSEEEEEEIPSFSVVGRPNAGKSTLINTLLGEERQIVTPVSGTTRDMVPIHYNKFGYDFRLIDTAGIRKKTKVSEDLEFYSVMRAIRAIERSDVSFLVVDATRGMEGQDVNIFRLIQKNKKGIVLVVNKWDLVEKDHHTMERYKEEIREKIMPFQDLPIVFISAKEQQRVLKMLDIGLEVYKNRQKRIPTSRLNEVMLQAVEEFPPPSVKGKYVKIKYVTQLPMKTPAFAFFCNLPQYVKDPYKRYLENRLRENFNFHGVPIDIFFRKK